ncbi:hypothetical protein V1508DRAFT_448904 [Lipomyces doorenjongii]|uniref:uncharacterized protein n=1 Tax=Lipomyces doorenjongii TaxID=383834 RepID=UPI0034CE576D
MVEEDWHVIVCTRCKFIIDEAHVIRHLKEKHKTQIINDDDVRQLIRQQGPREHLTVIWDEATERQLDESDDDDQTQTQFKPAAFKPGSFALRGIPVEDGFKCQLCEQMIKHVCVTTKEGMRSHYMRHHPEATIEYIKVKVQAFYDRSNARPQLRFVEVTGIAETILHFSRFGTPATIHDVPGHGSRINDVKDLNQFGVKFHASALLEVIDLNDLGNLLHNTKDESFKLLQKLCLRLLEASREDTMAGFQPLLGKVMIGDGDKEYFYAVQEHTTLVNYATIWAKVLWIACLAYMNRGTLHHRLTLCRRSCSCILRESSFWKSRRRASTVRRHHTMTGRNQSPIRKNRLPQLSLGQDHIGLGWGLS